MATVGFILRRYNLAIESITRFSLVFSRFTMDVCFYCICYVGFICFEEGL